MLPWKYWCTGNHPPKKNLMQVHHCPLRKVWPQVAHLLRPLWSLTCTSSWSWAGNTAWQLGQGNCSTSCCCGCWTAAAGWWRRGGTEAATVWWWRRGCCNVAGWWCGWAVSGCCGGWWCGGSIAGWWCCWATAAGWCRTNDPPKKQNLILAYHDILTGQVWGLAGL